MTCYLSFSVTRQTLYTLGVHDVSVPISTLILGPCRPELSDYFPESQNGELCENITYLGEWVSAVIPSM